jgi:hypothetical protein
MAGIAWRKAGTGRFVAALRQGGERRCAMAEIHEVREVREVPVPVRRSSPGALLAMFILGFVVAVVLVCWGAWSSGIVHTTRHPFAVNWTAGRVVFGDVNNPKLSLNKQ